MIEILTILNTIILLTLVILIFRKEKTKTTNSELNNEIDYKKEVENIRIKSAELMESAVVRAKLILDETSAFKNSLEEHSNENISQTYEVFISQLNQYSQEIIHSYEEFFTQAKEDLKLREESLLSQIEVTSQNQVSKIDTELEDEVRKLREEIKNSFAIEMSQTRQVIEDYKNSRIAEINDRIEEQIVNLSKKIFAEIIPIDKQKELIFNALENAKREGVFNI